MRPAVITTDQATPAVVLCHVLMASRAACRARAVAANWAALAVDGHQMAVRDACIAPVASRLSLSSSSLIVTVAVVACEGGSAR